MSFFKKIKDHKLVNLASQLKNPTLIRVDINVPLNENGRIMEDSWRLIVYSHVLELLSEYSGLVVLAHQGRRGEPELIPLKQHWITLRKLLPSHIDIEYIPLKKTFDKETKEKIKNLEPRRILLFDNVRLHPEEVSFNPNTSRLLNFFKGVIKSCVNDAIPVWHRAHTSLMMLPYIAKTYIGVRSGYELDMLKNLLEEDPKDCAIIIGGAKLSKAEYLFSILSKMEAFTGGLPGQLVAWACGYSLGRRNMEFLKKKLSSDQFELAKKLVNKFRIHHPIDFVVVEDREVRNIPLEEMDRCEGLIMDIGSETVEKYASLLQEKSIRIRCGPLGVYELGYNNGLKLTKLIAGNGLYFLGGDTSQEIITSTGGQILISGGAFLHGLAGFKYPSVDLILKMGE